MVLRGGGLWRGGVAAGKGDAMIFRRALESRMPSFAGPVDISQADGVLKLGFGGGPTLAGSEVNECTVDGIPAVYTCIRILADAISQSAPLLYRSLGKRGREEAADHPLYSTLRYLPNPEMTGADWLDVMARSMFGWGNAYSEVVRDSQGQAVALWPLFPGAMAVDRDPATRRKRYQYTHADGRVQTWFYDANRPPIHQWMINSLDGMTGRAPVRMLRESMGLTKAAEEFGARYFGGGAHPGGLLTTAGKLDPDRAKRMRDDWERLHSGLDRAHRVAVLEQGLTFEQVSIDPNDAQFLETRQFQDLQMAGVFGIPAFMINAASASNWGTGIESQKNALVSLTLRPYFEKIQQAMKRDLLGRRDFETYSIEFDLTPLLRGDYAQRMTGHATALNWGINTLNEVRELEGWNPVKGGDQPVPPLSTSSAGSSKDSTPDGGNAAGETDENVDAGTTNAKPTPFKKAPAAKTDDAGASDD
jgi:HK97 family phage portal protein